MGELGVRLLLRLLTDDTNAAPMAERLLEMYREWCRENGIIVLPPLNR